MRLGLISENIPVKSVRQSHDYDCGAACLRSLADFYGVSLDSESDFIEVCDTGVRKGTHPGDIVKGAERLGLCARLFDGLSVEDLKSFLDAGTPVICLIQAYGGGHYVVAVGYDDVNLYFEDPAIWDGRGSIPINEFVRRWFDRESYTGVVWSRVGIVISN